ncbi:hypothetical protein ACH5RR_034454 [Cinchona calisaya]|uniref:Uncharacterized protein n=1 Tax=Cinchona calisaya TaxID=153742 RepID=A0ABD2YAY2_9GENT
MASGEPQAPENIQTIKLLISVVRPFLRFMSEWYTQDECQELKLRLKHVDEVVQKVIQELHLQPLSDDDDDGVQENEDLVISNWNTLKCLKKEIGEIVNLSTDFERSITSITAVVDAENVVSFVDSLLQNLKDLLICTGNKKNLALRKETEDLVQMLMLLRIFFGLTPNRIIERDHVLTVFDCAQSLVQVISHVVYVFADCMNDETNDEWVNVMSNWLPGVMSMIHSCLRLANDVYDNYLMKSLELEVQDDDDDTPAMNELVLVFADNLIRKLRLLLSCCLVAEKHLFDILIDELKFIRCNFMDLLLENPVKEMKSISIYTQSFIFKTGLLLIQTSQREVEEDTTTANFFSFPVPDFLKAVDVIKQQASYLFIKFSAIESWQSNCQSINVLEYANFLVNKLEQLLHSEAAPLDALKHHIETAYEEIVSMRNLLRDVADLSSSQMESPLKRYKVAANQAEYVVDSFMAGVGSIWCHKLGLFVVTKDVKILHKEVKSLLTIPMTSDTVIPSLPSGTSCSTDEMHYRVEEVSNKLVGFKDAKAEIIELLTGGSRQLKIVSIVGMPGLGKTTLANSLYEHPSINLHFHVRAWCHVSQVYEKETLLSEIFSQIVGKTNQSHETSQEDVAQKLYQKLKGRRFLIVIDDIWDIKAWYDLKEIFPDDENGSRILFTTRYREVALKACSILYALRLLSLEESCELLWLKLFDGENCPPEFLTISTRIARNCRGLPLAVVLMAGTLKRTERREDCWEYVSDTLMSPEISDILEFSYKHLPNCLKPCFLYFGIFPKDTTISASKLIQLWICEGFVQQPKLSRNSLEQEAENYLNDLIDRSLVMISRRSSKGGVKAYRIHDLLRDFCLIKFKDERFLMHEDKFGGTVILHGDHEMRIGSLLYYSRSKIFSLLMLDSDFILQYKLLSVLDLENVTFGSSADTTELVNIAKLVHLRYLAIPVCITNIPSEIGNLQNLETFILTGATGKIILPEAIWNLVRLRYILSKHSFFSFHDHTLDFFQNFSQPDSLKSISAIRLHHGDHVDKFILRRLTGIQKLGCIFANSWDDATGCNLFPVLDFLSELESLKVFFSGKALYPCKFSFPVNLKKLTMSNARLPWDEISVIGQLPNLEVLKLLEAFQGQQWDMEEGEFQNLKFLKLDSLDIELWNASNEHFPKLEQLVVLSCQQLEEIPSSFGEIPTLQLIEMKWCSPSATESVKQILEEQRDMSNDQLNVIVVGPLI